MDTVTQQAARCKAAAPILAQLPTGVKNAALLACAQALEDALAAILAANAQDLQAAREAGMSQSMLDRLALTGDRVRGMADGLREVAALPDPIGQTVSGRTLESGLRLTQVRVPLGVVGIIYEARPNVTADAAALCLKSGNAALLRGGREAIHSNLAIGRVLRDALTARGLPEGAVQVVEDTGRAGAKTMMELTEYLDVLIPRGGRSLIRAVSENARVPVIRTGEGVCHIFVDESAQVDMAVEVLLNAKCSRPSVCNAVECVLVHRAVADAFWAKAAPALLERGVALRCDPPTLSRLSTLPLPHPPFNTTSTSPATPPEGPVNSPPTTPQLPLISPAKEADWDTEYNDLILACLEVAHLNEALKFIETHGTGHSEAILTQDYSNARRFLHEVDAAAVYVNASTRFTDGAQFGLGAEIGISTQKLHARGPMGLEALTSTKFLVEGSGQVR